MHCRIEEEILKDRLSRLAKLGFPEQLPLSGDAAEWEHPASVKERLNCKTIHKKFNLTSCYLCKQGNATDRREEKKKSNLGFYSFSMF